MDEQMKTGETGDKNAVIDQKLRQFFDGKIVRKDLTKKIKEGANVPVYVLEFLLGQYCSSDDPEVIETGVENVEYREIAAEALASEMPDGFDVVTCMEMLEHVPEPSSVVQACATLVRPGGWVFFSTLNRNPKSFLLGIVGAEYLLQLLPKGTHEYARFIRPSELAGWCRQAGLSLEASRGLDYNPLTRRFRLSADTSVNYLFACRKGA